MAVRSARQLYHPRNSKYEMIHQIKTAGRLSLQQITTYCPDKDSYQDYKPNLEIMLERASEESIEQMYLGDLNQDLLPKRLSTDARDLVQLFTSYQFTQLIKTPTRITARSQTLLDHIYTTDKDKVRTSGVMQCSISDHSLVYLIRRSKKTTWPFQDHSLQKLQELFKR